MRKTLYALLFPLAILACTDKEGKTETEAEGMLKIWLRGPDVRSEDGKKQKYYVEFAELNINGKPLLTEPVKVWHDAPKNFSLPVKAGEELEITAKYKTIPGGDR